MASQALAEQVRRILEKHGSAGKPMSRRTAQTYTGVSYGTISNWMVGLGGTRDKLRAFADGLREPRVPLLEAAGLVPEDVDRERDREHFGLSGVVTHTVDLTVAGVSYCGTPVDTPEDGTPLSEAIGADIVVRASGDSMEPYYTDGDLLFCRQVSAPYLLRRRYVVELNGQGTTCKALTGVLAENGHDVYTFEGTNGHQQPLRVTSDEASIRYVVVGKYVREI